MAMEKDAHTQVYQDVPVLAQTSYRASVWVQAVDLHGKGFGTHAGDSAGLCVIELDAAGKVLVEHPKAAVTKAGGFTQLSSRSRPRRTPSRCGSSWIRRSAAA